jgi:hypothetical protein
VGLKAGGSSGNNKARVAGVPHEAARERGGRGVVGGEREWLISRSLPDYWDRNESSARRQGNHKH